MGLVTEHIRICNADKWVGKRRVSIWFSSMEEERGRRKQRAETLCFASYLYGLARPVTRSCLPTPVTRDLAPLQQVVMNQHVGTRGTHLGDQGSRNGTP